MPERFFFAPIKIFNGNSYVYISAARAKAITPAWRMPRSW